MIPQGRVQIRMHIDPMTIGVGLDDLQAQFAEKIAPIWAQAQREPVLDGRAASAKAGKVMFAWRGPHAADIDRATRKRLEEHLTKAITGLAQLPAPEVADADISTWLGTAIEFSARLESLLAIMNDAHNLNPSYVQNLLARYADVLDQPVPGVVWVVEATLPTLWSTLYDGVMARMIERFPRNSPFFYIWDSQRRDDVVALDPGSLAGRVPKLTAPKRQPSRGEDFTTAPGTRIAFVAFSLPKLALEDMVMVGTEIEIRLPIPALLRDEAHPSDADRGWFTIDQLAAGMRVKPQQLKGLRETWPDRSITVRIVPLTARRWLFVDSLREFVLELTHRGDRFSDALGRLMLLGHRNVDAMPEEIAAALRTLADDVRLSTQDEARDLPHWTMNSIGAFVYPCVDGAILELAAAIPAKAIVEDQWLPELIYVLKINDLDDRSVALGKYLDKMQLGVVAFETLLIGLEHAQLLHHFFDSARLATHWDWGTRDERGAKIAVRALRSRYASDPALLALIQSLRFKQFQETWLTGPVATFDLQRQLIVLPGSGNTVYARGNSKDDKTGVLAEASDNFYSEKSKVRQLRPGVLQTLGDPLRKRVGEIVSKMACQGGETRTEKQLIGEATKAVMEEMSGTLKEDDFVEVTMRRSLRVLSLEEPVVDGVPRLYVRVEPVYKIGDGKWEASGPSELLTPGEFEYNRLTYYQVNHMVHFLEVFMMFETAVASGVFIVVAGIVELGELLLWVGISELSYVISDRHDITFEGLVEAALMGELQAVGFKGLSLLGTPLKLLGGRAISALGIGEAATKWVAFALKAAITSAEFGALGMIELFANDLMRMTRCRGMSSPSEYAGRFTSGFVCGVLMEFGGPALKPLLNKAPGLGALVRRASSSLELGAALRANNVAFEDVASVLLTGRRQLPEALAKVLDNPETTEAVLRRFEESSKEMLESLGKQLGRNYKRGAYSATMELLGVKLEGEVSRGLERLLARRKIAEVDALLGEISELGQSPGTVLRALGAVDEAAADALSTPARLAELARSPRFTELLTINGGSAGHWLLENTFKGSMKRFEGFLDEVSTLPAKESQRVLKALFEHEPLSPEALLKAAKEGSLDAAALDRLHAQADDSLAPRDLRGTRAEVLSEPTGRYTAASSGSKTIGAPTKSMHQALALYDDVISHTAGRLEVGIWQNEAGEYVVRLGQRAEVDAPAGWRAMRHYHTNQPDIRLWRMPARADVQELAQRAAGTGKAVSEIVEYPLPNGHRGRASYTVHGDGSVTIEFADSAGRRMPPKKFSSVGDYERYYESHKVYADPETSKALIDDWEASRPSADVDADADADPDEVSRRTATGTKRKPKTEAGRNLPANQKNVSPQLKEAFNKTKPPAYLRRQLFADGENAVKTYMNAGKADRAAIKERMKARDDSEYSILRDRAQPRPRDELEEQFTSRDPSFDDLSDDESMDDILDDADNPQGTFERGEAARIGTLEEAAEVAEFQPRLRRMGFGRTVYKTQFRKFEWLEGVYQGNRVPDFIAVDESGRRLLVGDATSSLQTTIPNEFGPGERLHFDKTVEHAQSLLQSLRGRADFAGWTVEAMDVVRSSTRQMQPKFIGTVQP